MQFHALVDEIQQLTVPEKEEVRDLLDKFLAEERRSQLVASYAEARQELEQGKLEFSGDAAQLRAKLSG